jgi:CRP-like cAMP-binding protein
LLHRGRRTASVAARDTLVLLSIRRGAFDTIVAPRFEGRAAAERVVRGRAVLAQSVLFQQLTPAEVDWLLTRLQAVSVGVGVGETIVRQGEPGDRFYLVASGSLQVRSEQPGGSVVLANLGPGDHFGEIALFFDTPRTATVVTECETEFLALSREEFQQLFRAQTNATQPLSPASQACYRLATERLSRLTPPL